MSDELADIIDAAADHIERNGWRRHSMYGDDGTVCALGGFQAAFRIGYQTPWYRWPEKVKQAVKILSDHLPSPADYSRRVQYARIVTRWNDQQAKNKQEVLDKMREVSKELRK